MLIFRTSSAPFQLCRIPAAKVRAVPTAAISFFPSKRSSLPRSPPPFAHHPNHHPTRTMSTSPNPTASHATSKTPDWSPSQYLLFRSARDRPIHDLLFFLTSQEANYSPSRIVDLGCGPGNSTSLLAARFPDATVSGVDSSPAMLTAARKALPEVEFVQADVREYDPPEGTDLLFANAVFHWLRSRERIPTVARLLRAMEPGRGVLALQVPDNFEEPSHRAMRETAGMEGMAWSGYFSGSSSGDGEGLALDPIEPELVWYDALRPLCRVVETWTTRYVHVLDGHNDIVEWVRGTGLQPFLNRLPSDGDVRAAFLEEYQRRLEAGYPRTADGKVLLAYPRRFVVAFR